MSPVDHVTVLAAARLGAEWAWTVIYREYSPALLRYLKGHGAQAPEDLLGEVFVQVVRNLPSFEGEEREFRTWLFTIARNRLIDEWRAAGRSVIEPVDHESLAALAGSGSVEDDAMHRLAEQRVMEVLARLTPDQHDVLFLRFFARLTIEEVAAVMGKRPGSVKALQARGLAAIRRAMSKEAVSL